MSLLTKVYLLCGIYIGIAVAGIIFIFLLLDTYKKIGLDSLKKEEKNPVQLLVNTLRHLRNKRQLLIIPLTLWSGFEQAYISADFTKVDFSRFSIQPNIFISLRKFNV